MDDWLKRANTTHMKLSSNSNLVILSRTKNNVKWMSRSSLKTDNESIKLVVQDDKIVFIRNSAWNLT